MDKGGRSVELEKTGTTAGLSDGFAATGTEFAEDA